MRNTIIKMVAKSESGVCVYTLTHDNSIGEGREVKNELMRLVADGILTAYDDGRKVRLA